MKRSLTALMILATATTAWAGDNTPTGKLDKRLGELLQPGRNLPNYSVPPATLPEPRRLADPWTGTPLLTDLPPRPVVEAGKPIRPRLTQEPAPLVTYRETVLVPAEIVMPTTALVALPDFVDVLKPIAVPILSQPLTDRASLADPTVDASILATLADTVPLRDQPVAFAPLNLPDPFEVRQGIKLNGPPPEPEIPMINPPRVILPPPPVPTK